MVGVRECFKWKNCYNRCLEVVESIYIYIYKEEGDEVKMKNRLNKLEVGRDFGGEL